MTNIDYLIVMSIMPIGGLLLGGAVYYLTRERPAR